MKTTKIVQLDVKDVVYHLIEAATTADDIGDRKEIAIAFDCHLDTQQNWIVSATVTITETERIEK
jgi:hypothetical protein